jgi:AcrR family transcriptional regulator
MEICYVGKVALDREAWLQKALEVLRTEGIQGVRIERLARDLGVTKGSFYWHFKNHPDLCHSILEYWSDSFTKVVVENPEFLTGDPLKSLIAAMSMVRKQGLEQYEVAIRDWADHDAVADKHLRIVYRQRTKFLRSLFERMGFKGQDAEVRTRMMLSYKSWETSIYADETIAKRLRMLKLQIKVLTDKAS